MIGATVHVADLATPRLLALRAQARRPRAVMAAAGKAVERELRAHFTRLDRKGNAKGWPRSHFWARTVRAATAFTGATDTSAEVQIASPEFAQRLYGGTLRAKRTRFLAIPLTARAKAAGSPREGGWRGAPLIFLRTSSGRALLIESAYTALAFRRGRVAGGRAMGGEAQYLLVRSVRQRPDPDALPASGVLERVVEAEAARALSRQTKQP